MAWCFLCLFSRYNSQGATTTAAQTFQVLCIWLQRAQAAELGSKEILKHSQEQQARLEEMKSELLSRPPSMGTLQAVLQGSVADDSEPSAQLLAQVLPMILTKPA